MRLRLDYGTDGLEVDLPDERVTVIEPVFRQAVPDAHEALLKALRAPIGPAAASRHHEAGTARGDLGLRHHARAAAARDGARAARGDARHPRRGRHDPHRHRHAPRGTRPPSSSGCSARDILGRLRSSTTTAATTARLRTSGRRQPAYRRSERRWLEPTCGSRPASSSRISSPVSAAARRWSRRAWPASRP